VKEAIFKEAVLKRPARRLFARMAFFAPDAFLGIIRGFGLGKVCPVVEVQIAGVTCGEAAVVSSALVELS